MREPLRDKNRLEHIIQAIEKIEEYTKDITKEQLVADPMRLHATTYNVQIVGEATYKLTPEFKKSHSEVQWNLIEKMRHILVHDYYQINKNVLWQVITEDLPALKIQVNDYLKEM
ncbi:MAG: DUF86 domain-containing protein [Bacteroidia bacterium]|nr:DUF86 domain-containing protein [Bacteroidia bacterium]